MEKIFKIVPVTQTITVGATQTAQVTNTAPNVVTVIGGELGGTVTVTASPTVETVTEGM